MTEPLAFIIDNLPNLLFGFPGSRPGGLVLSLMMTIVAVGSGFGMASLIGSGLNANRGPMRWLARSYVWVLRGLPLILLLLLVHHFSAGLLPTGLNRLPLLSAVIALTLHSSAYQATILQAGMQAMPKRLVDLAKINGHGARTVLSMRLRYAWHVMRPALTGQAIGMFKDTSVVIVLGVAELMTVANLVLGSELGHAQYWLELYSLVGITYFIVAFLASRLANHMDRGSESTDLIFTIANQ